MIIYTGLELFSWNMYANICLLKQRSIVNNFIREALSTISSAYPNQGKLAYVISIMSTLWGSGDIQLLLHIQTYKLFAELSFSLIPLGLQMLACCHYELIFIRTYISSWPVMKTFELSSICLIYLWHLGPAKGKQPGLHFWRRTMLQEGVKRRRLSLDGCEDINLRHHLIKVLERNTHVLHAQLESRRINSQLERKQQKAKTDVLISALSKISDALSRVADKLREKVIIERSSSLKRQFLPQRSTYGQIWKYIFLFP